jgi:hypothetical protein
MIESWTLLHHFLVKLTSVPSALRAAKRRKIIRTVRITSPIQTARSGSSARRLRIDGMPGDAKKTMMMMRSSLRRY